MKKILILATCIYFTTLLFSCETKDTKTTENNQTQTETTEKGAVPTKPFELNSYFQSGMLIQQNKPINVYGKAEEGVILKITLKNTTKNQEIQTIFKAGDENEEFFVTFDPIKASYDKYSIIILDSKNFKSINDILFGEVWLTSGQSNMRWPIKNTKNKSIYTGKVQNNDYIKFFDQERYPNGDKSSNMSFTPLNNFHKPLWFNLNNYGFAKETSGIAYVFAVELFEYLNKDKNECPVAFIQSSVDASSISAWLSKESIDSNPNVKDYLIKTNSYKNSEADMNKSGAANYNQMSALFNHKINPLKHINIQGVLWHQGGGDYTNWTYYEEAMTLLIKQYREAFGMDTAVLAVQQHSFDNATAKELRLAQSNAMEKSTKAAIIPTYDISPEFEYQEGYDMEKISGNTAHHPINKIEVGKRLFYAASYLCYNNPTNYLTPTFEKYEIINQKIEITIKNAVLIKTLNNETIKNLNVIFKNGLTEKANATILGNKIIIDYSSDILRIEYAFSSLNYGGNLLNELDLALIPFSIKIS